jgi:cation:H+ antiporter
LEIGLFEIFISARLVVTSGVEIAVILGAPPILLGAKVIGIGTSLPEFTTDLAAVRRGCVHLAIGGIIGSNLTILTLVLGLVLLTSPSVDITILTHSTLSTNYNCYFLEISYTRWNHQICRYTALSNLSVVSSYNLICLFGCRKLYLLI